MEPAAVSAGAHDLLSYLRRFLQASAGKGHMSLLGTHWCLPQGKLGNKVLPRRRELDTLWVSFVTLGARSQAPPELI